MILISQALLQPQSLILPADILSYGGYCNCVEMSFILKSFMTIYHTNLRGRRVNCQATCQHHKKLEHFTLALVIPRPTKRKFLAPRPPDALSSGRQAPKPAIPHGHTKFNVVTLLSNRLVSETILHDPTYTPTEALPIP